MNVADDDEIATELLEAEIAFLRKGEQEVKEKLIRLFTTAICSLADAAIIKQREYNIDDVVAAIEQLAEQSNKQREAVIKFLSAEGHDLCQENRKELATTFKLENTYPKLVPEQEFAAGCTKYRQEIYGQSNTDMQLYEDKIKQLTEQLGLLTEENIEWLLVSRKIAKACTDAEWKSAMEAMDTLRLEGGITILRRLTHPSFKELSIFKEYKEFLNDHNSDGKAVEGNS